MTKIGLTLLMMMCLVSQSWAVVPSTMNYQGYLTNSAGNAINSDSIQMKFNLYSVTEGGAPVWTETQNIKVINGYYNVVLGSVEPIAPSIFDNQLYLGLSIGSDSEMTPRKVLTSAPYTIKATKVESVDAASIVSGVLPNAILLGTYSSQLNLSNASNTINGTFSGTVSGSYSGTPITDQYLASSASWNNKISSVSASAPVVASTNNGSVTVSLPQATAVNDGYITANDYKKIIAAANANTGSVYRWNAFDTYHELYGWLANNNSTLFGGVAPSNWTDNNGLASQMTNNADILKSLFIHTAHAGSNALVYSRNNVNPSSTNGHVVTALFRIKNSTANAISWSPFIYYSSYGAWNEWASVALNGGNNWSSNASCAGNCSAGLALTLPANTTSTIIFVIPSGPNYAVSGQHLRTTFFAFYNSSLSLPAGLEYVDDLGTLNGTVW